MLVLGLGLFRSRLGGGDLGTVASLAVTEFMVFVTRLRSPAAQLVYRGEAPAIRRVIDSPEPGCYFCTGIWGRSGRR